MLVGSLLSLPRLANFVTHVLPQPSRHLLHNICIYLYVYRHPPTHQTLLPLDPQLASRPTHQTRTPTMPALNPSTLANITNRLNQGESSRSIASAIGVSKSFVNNLRQELPDSTPKPKAGRPPKLTPRDEREIVSIITRSKAKSAVQAAKIINQALPKPVCPQTVRRTLKAAGFRAKKKVKKPKLSKKNRIARLKWCQEHAEWTVHDWQRVIWSDETKVNRMGSDGCEIVWVQRHEGLNDRTIQPTVKFGGGNIMAWGAMTWAGVGKVHQVAGRMNAIQFVSILDQYLKPTLDACSIVPGLPSRDQFLFQQDNDPKHVSKLAELVAEQSSCSAALAVPIARFEPN